jgi:hypothetical protein
MSRRILLWVLSGLLGGALDGGTRGAAAHDGPPYTVIVDFHATPFLLSVWADPDVGIGTFHVYLERENPRAELPEDTRVTLLVQPVDGRIPETAHPASRQPSKGGRQYFFARVPFDARGWWRVRVEIESSAGKREAETRVQVTPPGSQGPLVDFAMFLFPFLAVGFLFIKAIARRRSVAPGRR